jgi:aspartyl-tRNA(Asn)/glutamyl-tRNA(Gln) amidotransferase subunit C
MPGQNQKITIGEVEYVAKLARLMISQDEASHYTDILNDILGYMDKLREIDTKDVEPMTHAIPNINVMRDDTVKPSDASSDILKNAPDAKGTFFRVPKVIE